MDRFRTLRNVAIVLLLAAAVDFLPQGGRAANTFGAVLSVVFAGGLAYFAGRMYLEHRTAVYGLGDRTRGVLYGALTVGAVTIAAQPRMWQTATGELAWFALLALVLYALTAVYRSWRSYT